VWLGEQGASDTECDGWDDSDTENRPRYTFVYDLPCIEDPDYADNVRATFGPLESFMTLEELADTDCQYGTRWKLTCKDVTAEDIGSYEISISLADSWDHTTLTTLSVHIQEFIVWVPWDDTADILVTLAENATTSAYIERVSSLGEVRVVFNRTMQLPLRGDNRTAYEEFLLDVNETLSLYIEPSEYRPILVENETESIVERA